MNGKTKWKVTAKCEMGHETTIVYEGDRKSAELFGATLDGSLWGSRDLRRQHVESMRSMGQVAIGMCMWAVGGDPPCGNMFECTVHEA